MVAPLITDSQFNSIALIVIAFIGIVPTTLAAYWAKQAKSNSDEAKVSSAKAEENSAGTLHEVKANGGMSDPDPTLKDYIKFVGENVESQGRRLSNVESILADHLEHGKIMDSALAHVFLAVRPQMSDKDMDALKDFL